MRKTLFKWFWIWNFDQEEKWLREMAEKGLSLIAVGFCTYTFEESMPGEYEIRIELLENVPTHAESVRYIKFIEETGAEYLGSVIRWVYFRKKKCDGSFDIYSDFDSRIKHLNRILSLIGIIFSINIFNSLNMVRLYFSFYDPTVLILGLLLIAVELVTGFGFLRILKKKKKLYKEKLLFE